MLPSHARLLSKVRQNSCNLLLVSLCLFILADPFVWGNSLSYLFLLVCAGSIAVMMSKSKRNKKSRILTWVILFLMMTCAEILVTIEVAIFWSVPVTYVFTGIFSLAIIIELIKYIMDRRLIGADKISAAISVYIMIAILFSNLFSFLHYMEPKSFFMNPENNYDGIMSWSEFMYFSFTVLTSTGFGDILPITHHARSFVILEQIMGVMYVAFLIARLTNLYTERHKNNY